jgi:hypothetical protein
MANKPDAANPAIASRFQSGITGTGSLIRNVRRNMSAACKSWCLGAVVAINGLLAPSLAYTWLSIYRQYSYPIDFFLPIERTEARATLSLCVVAITVPLAFVIYARTAHDLPSPMRIATLVITSGAAVVAVAFAGWRYLR